MSSNKRLRLGVSFPLRNELVLRADAEAAGVPPEKIAGLAPEKIGAYGLVSIKDTWFEAEIDDVWLAAYRMALEAGQPVVAELRVFPIPRAEEQRPRTTEGPGEWRAKYLGSAVPVPPGGLTARVLRKVRVGEHASSGNELLAALGMLSPPGPPSPLMVVYGPLQGRSPLLFREVIDILPRSGTAGRPVAPARQRTRPALVLLRAAADYAGALARGSRSPVADIARASGRSINAMRMMVFEARSQGLLTPTIQGRGGGHLTLKARALIRRYARALKLKK